MAVTNNGPIYIGGLDRSGKTTMQAFLTSHPRIAIPYAGSNLWRFFYGQYGQLAQRDNFERCLAAMLRYSHVLSLNPDPERIRREFRQGPATYARLFALLHEHYAEQQGKPRWGDQSGLIESYADYLFAADAGAKLVHMLRDPRDRYEASLARAPEGKGRAGGAAARWLYSVQRAERNAARYPGRYLVVRFETLITQPEETVRQVCIFLGEDFDPAMLSMCGSPRQREKMAGASDAASGQNPLSTEFIGGFRQNVPDFDIAFIQAAAGNKMHAYGYAAEPIRFSTRDRLRFGLLHWPANMARMAAWRGREAMHNRRPSQFGFRPDRKATVADPAGSRDAVQAA